ncbi:oxidoreductase-like protein [Paraphoma chrysanthemicola]|nr:oxidoreductase-like protein [Paraphoma chrysanthemicola]
MSQDPGQKYSNTGINFTTDRHDTYSYINPSNFNLKEKHILITGASKGVGKAAAISYAQAGASQIAIAARSPLEAVTKEVKEAAKQAGRPEPEVLALKLDVTNRDSVTAAAKDVTDAFDGRIDVLVNNAGYLSSFAGIPDTDPEEWWRDWEVNVKGVYLVTHAFWPLLLNSDMKIILNVSSIGATAMTPLSSSYSSGKLAILRLTEFINQDHGEGKDGMLAIALHPGGVKTELATGMPEAYHGWLIDTPELAGDTFAWLGAERREWLAGRYVSACWDMEELSRKKEGIVAGDLLKVRLAVNTFPN